MLLCLAQLCEHRGQLHGFINIARRHEQTAYIRLLVACKRFEEVIEIQNSDHVIHAVLINRDARERRILDRFDLIGHVLVDIQRYNVNTRGHYLGGHYIRKVYRRLHKLGAILVKDILVLGSLYDRAQLLDGGFLVGVLRFALEPKRQQLYKPDDKADKRHEYDRQAAHEIGVGQRQAICTAFGYDLRYCFAEDDNQDRYRER